MGVPKRDRLQEFFRRLLEAPAAVSFDEAFTQLANILNAVEDELTGTPYDPDSWRVDGRIYPPQPDNLYEVEGHSQVKRFRTVAHNIYIGANGSMQIIALDGTLEVRKLGADERDVWELH